MHKIRNFHEGHSTVGEWQGSGRERHGNGMVCVNRPLFCHLLQLYRLWEIRKRILMAVTQWMYKISKWNTPLIGDKVQVLKH
jgi:hypothetical protein